MTATTHEPSSRSAAEHRRQPRPAQRTAPERRSRRARRWIRGQAAPHVRLELGEPAAAVVPARGRRQPRRLRDALERVDGDARPREPARGAGVVLQAQRSERTPASGRLDSQSTAPSGVRRPARRRSSASGSPPMPMLPSSSSARAPAAHGGDDVEDRRRRARACRGRGPARPRRGSVDPDAAPRGGERADVAPGAAADVEHRAAGAASTRRSVSPAPASQRAAAARGDAARGHAATRPAGRRRGARRRTVARPRGSCHDLGEGAGEAPAGRQRCDGAGVGDVVDVAQRRELARRAARGRAAARAAARPVSSRRSSARRKRSVRASRRPMAQ